MSLADALASIGLGYAIAIALGFLVLLAAVLLAFHFCRRRRQGHHHHHHHNQGAQQQHHHHSGRHAAAASSSASSSGHISITVPRFVFVAEDDSPGSSSRGATGSTPVGLDPAVIASYPKAPFARAAAAGDLACSICLCEYRDGEMQRIMPECRHRFHLMCLDAWLRRSASCPVCRSSPIPTPVTTPLNTPLSEIVPLSQYAADRRRHR
ncbi:RING-H2 finger protein ATL67 [Hordeum vulgare]|nr:RING-H2 finger protein ATL67 [Hordeum vulgare]